MAKNTKIDYYKELQKTPMTTEQHGQLQGLIDQYEAADTKGRAATIKLLMEFEKAVSEEQQSILQAGKDLGIVEEEPELGPAPKTFSEEEVKEIDNKIVIKEETPPAKINGKIATDEEVEAFAKENLQASQLFDAVRDAVAEAMEKAKGYINVPGALYSLPMYQIAQEIGLQPIEGATQFLPFVKGALDTTKVPQQHGIILEDLYPVLILHLEELDKVVPSDETKAQIGALKCAFEYCMKRIIERKLRKVWGTMQK
jgi:hypothetical protein